MNTERSIEQLGDAAASLSSRHGVWADIYAQSGASHAVRFDDGRLDTLSSARADGVGVRIVRGDDTAYASTPGATVRSVDWAMREASDISGLDFTRPDAAGDASLFDGRAALPSLDASFFHDIDKMVRAECRWVRQASFRYTTSARSVLIVRGDGQISRESRTYTTFAANIVLEHDGALETGYESRSMTTGADAFWTSGEPSSAEAVARTALARAVLMLDAVPCPAGTMTVLLEGSAGGTIIHEACGHSLEADIIQKDFSVFRDRIGERVASPVVTMIDDATLPGRYGSYERDDEGTPAARTVLIEDGVLKCYLTDITTSRIGGLPLTGNGRRESYRCAPMPRMSNTFIAPGTGIRDEMLAGVKRGLLVRKMGGGEVDPTSGNFVFYVSEGYEIRDGRIGSPVRGATLTGNGPEVLMNISAVGRELVLDPGTCGKSGQGVPVTDGQPTLLIENMTVGGSDAGDAS